MNEISIKHTTRQGVTFECERADLRKLIKVTYEGLPPEPLVASELLSPLELMAAAAEFTAWHALNIFDQLNGFSGYDNIRFVYHRCIDCLGLVDPEDLDEGLCRRCHEHYDNEAALYEDELTHPLAPTADCEEV